MDPELKRLSADALKQLHRRLMWFHERYADGLFAQLPQPARTLARLYYLGNIKLHFDIHERNHTSSTPWPMPCTAGTTTFVIDHDGHFRSCELRSKLGRLQDFDFNLDAALHSQQMKREVAAIPQDQCWCTHSCWIHTSTKFSPRTMLFHIPWSYLKHRWERLPALDVAEVEKFRVADAPV
jgi:hypothetical protein